MEEAGKGKKCQNILEYIMQHIKIIEKYIKRYDNSWLNTWSFTYDAIIFVEIICHLKKDEHSMPRLSHEEM